MDIEWGPILLGLVGLLFVLDAFTVRQHRAAIKKYVAAAGGKLVQVKRHWFTWGGDYQYRVSFRDAAGHNKQTGCRADFLATEIYWQASPREILAGGMAPPWAPAGGSSIEKKLTDDVRQRHKVWDINR